MTDEERAAALAAVHAVGVVYPKSNDGANANITFDAYIEETNGSGGTVTKKVPVTTVKNNKQESHFFFDKAPETHA